jgi:hypothetical protein
MEGLVSPVSLMMPFFSLLFLEITHSSAHMRAMSPCISLHEACNYYMASLLAVAKWLARAFY